MRGMNIPVVKCPFYGEKTTEGEPCKWKQDKRGVPQHVHSQHPEKWSEYQDMRAAEGRRPATYKGHSGGSKPSASASAVSDDEGKPKKRSLSKEALDSIRLAQQKRWQAYRDDREGGRIKTRAWGDSLTLLDRAIERATLKVERRKEELRRVEEIKADIQEAEQELQTLQQARAAIEGMRNIQPEEKGTVIDTSTGRSDIEII